SRTRQTSHKRRYRDDMIGHLIQRVESMHLFRMHSRAVDSMAGHFTVELLGSRVIATARRPFKRIDHHGARTNTIERLEREPICKVMNTRTEDGIESAQIGRNEPVEPKPIWSDANDIHIRIGRYSSG